MVAQAEKPFLQASGRGTALQPLQEKGILSWSIYPGPPKGHLKYQWAEVSETQGDDLVGSRVLTWSHRVLTLPEGYDHIQGVQGGIVCPPRTWLGRITQKDQDLLESGLC